MCVVHEIVIIARIVAVQVEILQGILCLSGGRFEVAQEVFEQLLLFGVVYQESGLEERHGGECS